MSVRPFMHGYEACFEEATVRFAQATEPATLEPDQSAGQVLTVYHQDGTVTFPTPPSEDGFVAELRHTAECVAANKPSDILAAQSARDALALVYQEIESVKTGKVVPVA